MNIKKVSLFTAKFPGSYWPIFGIFILYSLINIAYILCIPSFEGPDESEHYRRIEGVAKRKTMIPIDPKDPLCWGYQVQQPPLYYWILGFYARCIKTEFADRLVSNASQNYRYPFIRHDLPGEQWPWDRVYLGLHLLRIPSLIFGLLVIFIMWQIAKIVFPKDSTANALFITLAMFFPNILHMFSVINNDGLSVFLTTASILTALLICKQETLSSAWFLVCGTFLSLATVTKLTAFIPIMVVGTMFFTDISVNRRWSKYAKGVLWMSLPLILISGGYIINNYIRYDDPILSKMLISLTPGGKRVESLGILETLLAIFNAYPKAFVAELCWLTYRLDALGPIFFWPWFSIIIVSTILACRNLVKNSLLLKIEYFVPIISLFWGFVFAVIINREWHALQIRHLLSVFPVTMIAPVHVITCLPRFITPYRKLINLIGLGSLLIVNVYVLINFRIFHANCKDPKADRDYHTFLYAFHNNAERAMAYIEHNSFLHYDIDQAFNQGDCSQMTTLVEQAWENHQLTPPILYKYAINLQQCGQPDRALFICKNLAPRYTIARPLHVQLLLDANRHEEARQALNVYLQDSQSNIGQKLQRLNQFNFINNSDNQ